MPSINIRPFFFQQVSFVISHCPRPGARRIVRVQSQSGKHARVERAELGIGAGVHSTNRYGVFIYMLTNLIFSVFFVDFQITNTIYYRFDLSLRSPSALFVARQSIRVQTNTFRNVERGILLL